MVIEAEPDTIQPKDATTDNSFFILANVFDGLTFRDFSSGEPKIVPKLAESYTQQPDPKTWRFKLRSGVKFHNGEPLTADAVVAIVTAIADKDKPGQAIDEYGLAGATATKVDDLTVDITTRAPDAIFPSRVVKMPIPAPQWFKSAPQDASILQLVGSGPYKLIEYQKAGHFLLRANEEYWGNPKPSIAEIKIVFRNEAVVRSSMLQAGEVQLATLLTLEDAKKLPAYFIELTGEAVGLRINTEHDLLKDLRVRQAINMSIDRKGMMDALYPEVAEGLNGMMVRKSSVGFNANLKEYPYDVAKAKQLMQEAGATGKSIELTSRNGVFPTGRRGERAGGGPDRAIGPEGGDQVVGSRPVAHNPAPGQAGRGSRRPPVDGRQRSGARLVSGAHQLLRLRRGQRPLVRPGVDRQVHRSAGAGRRRPCQGVPGAVGDDPRPERVRLPVRSEFRSRPVDEVEARAEAAGPDPLLPGVDARRIS